MKNFNKPKTAGFTLLEILLVVAAIGILAGIVVFAINPAKQLADTRDAQRKVDVNTILNAVWQYAIDNGGSVPDTITTTQTHICQTGISNCGALIDLSVLTDEGKYLVIMPSDPQVDSTSITTSYTIGFNEYGHVTVEAPYSELVNVSVTR